MNKQAGLSILRVVLGLVVGGYSAALVVNQLHGPAHLPLLVLGIAEVAAAILFLIPKTLRVGGISLIIIFAIAAGFHMLHGEYNVANLAVYGAAALAVISNGRTRA